jgi:hypothetical protein
MTTTTVSATTDRVSTSERKEAQNALRDAAELGLPLSPEEAVVLRDTAAGIAHGTFTARLRVLAAFDARNPRRDARLARLLAHRVREVLGRDPALLSAQDRATLARASRSWDVTTAEIMAVKGRLDAACSWRRQAAWDASAAMARADLAVRTRQVEAMAARERWVMVPGDATGSAPRPAGAV